MSKPRILYVSPHWPHKATSASELRAQHIGRALQEMSQVEVVVVDGEGGEQEWVKRPAKDFNVACSLSVQPRPDKSLCQKLNGLLNPRTYYPHGKGVDDEATQRVIEMAADFDLIWFCKLRTANAFPQWAWPRSVVDVDDVPSTYARSVWQSKCSIRERLVTAARIFNWWRREKLLGDRFDVIGVCSETDRRYLQKLGVGAPMHVIPNGYDRPLVPPNRKPAVPPRIGFIGIFDYSPNLMGIQWFVSQCWSRIKLEVPDARLRLVGRESDGSLKPAGLDIDGLGWVADVTDEIATWSAMIVPIQVGSGTRGKIAHALSQKCPIVSTALGAYGYEAVNGREMYLADSAEDFANACVRVIQKPAEAAAVAERAWEQFLKQWTWDAIRPRIWAAAEECLRKSPARLESRDADMDLPKPGRRNVNN